MNSFYRQVYSLVLCAAVATVAPMYGMETEVIDQSSVVWYKKSSVKIAAVAMTTAVAAYALAVYMDKVSSPVVLAGMLCACVAKDVVTQSEQNKNEKQDNVNVPVDTQDQFQEKSDVVTESEKTVAPFELKTAIADFKKSFSSVMSQYVNRERTEEDFDAVDFTDKY
jgi:hypothetical protein